MSSLRVTPSEVHQSGVEIGEIAATIKSAFTNSDGEITSAQSGWMGRSAGALASIAGEWQEATKALAENLVDHGNKFTAAAKKYDQVDASGANSVGKAAQDI